VLQTFRGREAVPRRGCEKERVIVPGPASEPLEQDFWFRRTGFRFLPFGISWFFCFL
jgi:hypothetical protein